MPAVDTESQLAVVVKDKDVAKRIKGTRWVKKFTYPSDSLLERFKKVFVSVSLSDLPDVSEFVREANDRHYLKCLLVRDEGSPNLIPQYLHRAKLRTLRNLIVHSDAGIPGRIVRAHAIGAEKDLIADAKIIGNQLTVLNCAGELCEVELARIRPLSTASDKDVRDLGIEDDGSYIYWPALDLHLDIRAIREASDPLTKEKAREERIRFDGLFGKAVARLRKEHRLRQSDIRGLSERQVRRIEKDGGPTTESLRALAESHGLPLNKYLNALAEVIQELRREEVRTA